MVDFAMVWVHLPTAYYPSPAALFYALQNGPVRLYFPFLVALVAAFRLSGDLENRFIANTRSRIGIQTYLRTEIRRVATSTFGIFGSISLVKATLAFTLIPAVMPKLIQPGAYAGSLDAIQALDESQSPLAATLRLGWPAFALSAGIWTGANASALAALSVVAMILLKNRVLALLLPAGIYVLESFVTQLLELPGQSFLISALYPGGLQNYPLWQALVPLLSLGLTCAITLWYLVRHSPHNQRFA